MICPACGLINPDSAQQYDCGYDFAARENAYPLFIQLLNLNVLLNLFLLHDSLC